MTTVTILSIVKVVCSFLVAVLIHTYVISLRFRQCLTWYYSYLFACSGGGCPVVGLSRVPVEVCVS